MFPIHVATGNARRRELLDSNTGRSLTTRRSEYKRKAARAQERYKRDVEAYQDLHPGWKAPSIAFRKEKESTTKPRLRRAYDVYLREQFQSAEVMDKPKEERMRRCAEGWRSMDAKDRLAYQERADVENEAFILSLPEDKQAELKQKLAASKDPTKAAPPA